MASYLLPPAAYWSDEWLERERTAVFEPNWHLAASLDVLSEPGDYVTVDAGRSPLMVIRGKDGALRAFHNICRHRGMVLLEGAGNAGRQVTCFYHEWRYGLDGELRVVPQRREQFADLDVAEWGLLPAAVDTWAGMVFVRARGGPSLAEALGDLPAAIGSYRPEELRQVATATLDLACNWKLFVENHVDVYHLWYLHERSLGDFDHTRFEHRAVGEHWTSWEPMRAAETGAGKAGLASGTVPIASLDDRDRHGLGAHLVFPSLMIAASADFFATYVAEPVTAERTRLHLRIRAEAGADGDALAKAVRSFIEEDVTACEAIQRAVRSSAFGVGPLAHDHEAPITDFHRNLLARLEP